MEDETGTLDRQQSHLINDQRQLTGYIQGEQTLNNPKPNA